MGHPRLPAIDFRRLQRIASTVCPSLQLAVEIDGSQHRDEAGLRYDAERDSALASVGIKVLRFTNQEALAATEYIALLILDEVERLSAIRPKPPVGSSRRRDVLLPHPGPLPR